jgi:hypothetical protein
MQKADEILKNYPLELRAFMDKEGGEIKFNYLNKDIKHSDLLWKNIESEFGKINPQRWDCWET